MKLGFVGSVRGSRRALQSLVASGFAPDVCVTLPPEAAHRHSDFADLSDVAKGCGARLLYTSDINDEETVAALEAAGLDVLLVIGWSQICRVRVRDTARIGAVGYHPAPLPRFRGRAVIPWTILTGEVLTASTLFWLDEGMDSGPIIAQRFFAVAADETATTLYAKHNDALAEMLPEAVAAIARGEAAGHPQDEAEASYCARRVPGDGLIDWKSPAKEVIRLVRAVAPPYPGAFTYQGDERIVIHAIRPFDRSDRFIGLPGQVQAHTGEGFLVRCGDSECVEVIDWQSRSNAPPRLHSRLEGSPR